MNNLQTLVIISMCGDVKMCRQAVISDVNVIQSLEHVCTNLFKNVVKFRVAFASVGGDRSSVQLWLLLSTIEGAPVWGKPSITLLTLVGCVVNCMENRSADDMWAIVLSTMSTSGVDER